MSFGIASVSTMLGIRGGMNIAVHAPPEGFMEALLPLPEGAALVNDSKTGLDLQIVFTLKKTEVVERLGPCIRGMAVMGGIWIVFQTATDAPHAPTEDFVRLAALENGLVDTKKVMLGPVWTALKLQWKPRGPRVELPSARA
ncbi:MAG: DUF3052 domain-containing protein [Archangium sp.]